MKQLKSGKLFPVFVAISAAIVIAGIVLFALLGFNTAMDKPQSAVFEVRYDVVLEIDGKEGDLQAACEKAFDAQGISYLEKTTNTSVDSETLSETMDHVLSYTFAKSVPAEKLAAARDAVNAETFGDASIHAQYHLLKQDPFGDEGWRGAIAIAVGVIAALIYLGARFGVSCAVAGGVCTAHDALFTAALFAVLRIPVFAGAPLLYAAIAAAVSLLVWTIASIRLRETLKSPEYAALPAYERAGKGVFSAAKPVLFTALAIAATFVLLGGIAAAGVRAFVLPMLVSVAVPLYSCFLIGPWVYAPVKRSFDRRKEKKNGGYVGKKKAD